MRKREIPLSLPLVATIINRRKQIVVLESFFSLVPRFLRLGKHTEPKQIFWGGGVQCSRIKLRTSPRNKYLVVLAWFSWELQADYVVCRGQEVPLIFLRPAVCLELISISCVYAVSAGDLAHLLQHKLNTASLSGRLLNNWITEI